MATFRLSAWNYVPDPLELRKLGYRLDFRVVRDEVFGQKGPASTMVQVASLSHPDYMIEVEALAVV